MRGKTNYIFEASCNHPFIQRMAKGEVGKGQLIHYVKQYYEYLNTMIQTKSYGPAKCTSHEGVEMENAKTYCVKLRA